ncbi:MAG: CpsD/CapB family tyrosine-protein kinase [Planctomycetaceae bacterium]|nr:CpsD/CapB family tyrosine-protein kinase [Planctomycetaceae bacterium]
MGNVFDAMKRAAATEKPAPAPAPRIEPLPRAFAEAQADPGPAAQAPDLPALEVFDAQETVEAAAQQQRRPQEPQPHPHEPVLASILESNPVKPVKPHRKIAPVISESDVRYSTNLVAWHERTGQVAEQYRALRTQLIAHFKDKPFAAIVTSAQSGEGKTITCLNLALSLAGLKDSRTVVVDCDFRRSTVGAMLHDSSSKGLADVLRGQASINEVMRPTPYPNFSVVLAGRSSQEEAPELMARGELDDVVRHMQKNFDYVLFDTPPINALADAGMIGRLTGEALLVVRMNKTQREAVQAALHRLEPLRVRVAGLVLVGQKYLVPHYLYDQA